MKLIVVVVLLVSLTAVYATWDPCAGLPNGTGFVNNPEACPYYFSCVSGTAFRVSCPDGFYFDERRLVCDLPRYANCQRCQPNIIHGIDDPTDCQRWILCVYGTELPQKCGPGTSFNPTLGTCDLNENVRCPLHTCLNIEGGIGLAPAPDDCHAYFYCFEGGKVLRGQCAPGLAFDSVHNRCVRLGQQTCFPGTSVRRANVPIAPSSSRL